MAIQETAFQWQKYYCFSIVFWRKHQGDSLLSISWVTFWGWVPASSKSRLLEIAVTSEPSYIRTSVVTHSACQRLILCWYLARPDVGITAQSHSTLEQGHVSPANNYSGVEKWLVVFYLALAKEEYLIWGFQMPGLSVDWSVDWCASHKFSFDKHSEI